MKNIFLLYMAPGNYEQMVHYEETIKQPVLQDRIFRLVDPHVREALQRVFGSKPIATWGSRSSDANRSKFEKMLPGDDVLIVEGGTIKLLGKIAAKTVNADLSKELWKNLKGDSVEGWDLIYFIANPVEIGVSFVEFNKLFGYAENYKLQGFTTVADDKLKSFYERYDDLYSILLRIKRGESYTERPEPELLHDAPSDKYELTLDDVDEALQQKELSDHVIMQWKLIRLGMKAGSKVWIPRNDQSRITKEYDFKDFETEFTSGLDTPAKFVENIDVVWKEQYRIDAAFEVENSTSIYSGLLRFSDLKIVAPNSTYPLFIVAPTSKKNRLIEQLKRPTFKELEFDKKVSYLSYETVSEIDRFFENSDSGLSVDLIASKAEVISI